MLKTNIVLLYGLPASGKSFLAKEYAQLDYAILSRDVEGGSIVDLIPKLKSELESGKNVVIDATNYLKTIRQEFIDFAKIYNYTIGIHIMDTKKDEALINSLHRMYNISNTICMHNSNLSIKQKKIPNYFVISAIFNIAKKMEKPKLEEGFTNIITTKFKRLDNYSYKNKAIFVDLDETVRTSLGTEKYPIIEADVKILPNSESILKDYKKQNYKIIAISNQSGIAKSLLTHFTVKDIFKHTNSLMDYVFDDFYYCPHLPPKDVCYCRKPQSGLGVLAMHTHELDLTQCIMVGDQTSDKTFAERLGIKYHHPDIFFNRV